MKVTTRTQPVHKACTALAAAGAALLTLSTPALAQDGPSTFSLPAGCDAYLTIQSQDCSVDHHFTCEGDPAGHKSRVSLSQMGMTYMGTVDDETQWLNSFHVLSNRSESLDPNPTDPASISELIEIGIDTYDFTTTSPEDGVKRFVGQDSLTGRQITIDDVTLDETQYNITAYDGDGEVLWRSEGNEFISQNWRFFLAGTSKITTPDDSYEVDGTPVEFIYPGEPGFLSANPKHGCGVEMSSLEATPMMRLIALAN